MATRGVFLLPLLMIALLLLIKDQTIAGTSVNTEIEQEILKIDSEKDEAMQKFVASHGKVAGDVLDQIYADSYQYPPKVARTSRVCAEI